MVVGKYDHRTFEKADFSGQMLVAGDLSHSTFKGCNFDNADLTEANCAFSDFSGSTFRETNCHYTNFMRSKLAACVWTPKDCYGATFTFDCKTFENVRIGQMWWFAVLTMWASMEPERAPVRENLRDALISCIGAQRYVRLRQMLRARQI